MNYQVHLLGAVALIFSMSKTASAAFEIEMSSCDDQQLVERVCGGSPRRDPTGVGMKWGDLEQVSDRGHLTQAGIQRYRDAYGSVVRLFVGLSKALLPSERKAFQSRLDELQAATKEELEASPGEEKIAVYYNQTLKSVYPTPALLNIPALSQFTLMNMVAWAVGEHMGGTFNNGGSPPMEWIDDRASECFQKNYADQLPFGRTLFKARFEIWGRWFGSMAMNEWLKKEGRKYRDEELFAITQNMLRVDCPPGEKATIEEGVHVLRMARQPFIRRALRCSGVPMEHEKPAVACSLKGKVPPEAYDVLIER